MKGEEIVVTRNRRRVARILPEPQMSTAMEVFGGLHATLVEGTGAALASKVATVRHGKPPLGTLRELHNPWVS